MIRTVGDCVSRLLNTYRMLSVVNGAYIRTLIRIRTVRLCSFENQVLVCVPHETVRDHNLCDHAMNE